MMRWLLVVLLVAGCGGVATTDEADRSVPPSTTTSAQTRGPHAVPDDLHHRDLPRWQDSRVPARLGASATRRWPQRPVAAYAVLRSDVDPRLERLVVLGAGGGRHDVDLTALDAAGATAPVDGGEGAASALRVSSLGGRGVVLVTAGGFAVVGADGVRTVPVELPVEDRLRVAWAGPDLLAAPGLDVDLVHGERGWTATRRPRSAYDGFGVGSDAPGFRLAERTHAVPRWGRVVGWLTDDVVAVEHRLRGLARLLAWDVASGRGGVLTTMELPAVRPDLVVTTYAW